MHKKKYLKIISAVFFFLLRPSVTYVEVGDVLSIEGLVDG